MDEAQSLEAVANILGEISLRPFDLSLHLRHVELAKTLDDLESQLTAFQMASEFLAVGDDIWVPYIDAKAKSVDLETEAGVEELLQLYERAEADYLSIPILQKHLNFILEQHSKYYGEEATPKPESLGELFSTAWTRETIQRIVSKGIEHVAESHLLFDAQRDWELEQLEKASPEDAPILKDHVGEILLLRLKQAHSNSDETFQAYSSFTSKYRSPSEYETTMVAASKIRGNVVKGYERREPLEIGLKQSSNSLEAFSSYITYERRAKNPDLLVTRGIYERAISEAAKRTFRNEPGAEAALFVFWAGYFDALRLLDVGVDVEGELFKRALRSVPGSGEVWARYIRFLERASETMVSSDLEAVSNAYNRAINTGLIQKDMEQLIPVTLAYASYEKRQLTHEEFDENAFASMIAAVEGAIQTILQSVKEGDPKFRLEKFLVAAYEDLQLIDNAVEVWQEAAKRSRFSYNLWISYTDLLTKHKQYDQARAVFADIHKKKLDWPEVIWEAWSSFEHLYGSVEDIDSALDKIEKARNQVNFYRARDAAQAYEAAQAATAAAQPSVPIADTSTAINVDMQAPSSAAQNDAMEVDSAPSTVSSKKRTADDEELHDAGSKKARTEAPSALKRDRENTTVFVADLPASTKEDDLKALFKDCGGVREVKITQLPNALVALVEFYTRDSIPAALTKDKKRVHEQEIAVHLAWKSTLYVTNFPESADDAFIRNLFGTYGILFDVRWPSKKFKQTRRFCYVQFTSPTAAENALELHGRELEPNLPLNVYMSNPERKKERTDHDANEREVYVAGLSKFTNKDDLQKLFSTYGKVKDIRLATERDGHARGYAFVEYENPQDARRALDANNYELKKRRIAVTLADPRVRARHTSETGLGRQAEARARSVRVRNVPTGTQEGILQQAFEKISLVRRVELFGDKGEAVVELESPAEAGKLLLRPEPIVFEGKTLRISEEGKEGSARNAGPPVKTGGLFVPRKTAGSRPRAGLGFVRPAPAPAAPSAAGPSSSTTGAASSQTNKGQDDFRKMLGGK
ncbi:hypothetical protein D9611_008706 [Ephemerocybe angulata]|uniref:U4/U6 snRNA-associated-splicing factor PRP24 n=1 Tax=Ephemerocybe angulata TaxID=980116 RepID=A0A8H5FJD0_9AGAR|nr:hypothetical protein D9611_008706 [Tulosesus angulatus]